MSWNHCTIIPRLSVINILLFNIFIQTCFLSYQSTSFVIAFTFQTLPIEYNCFWNVPKHATTISTITSTSRSIFTSSSSSSLSHSSKTTIRLVNNDWKIATSSNSINDRSNSTLINGTTTTTQQQYDSKVDDTDNNNISIEQIRLQAKQLRDEASRMKQAIADAASQKEIKRIEKVDGWIEQLLIYQKFDTVEQLNTVQQVVTIIINYRYSPEQIYQVFERLCKTTSIRGRDSILSNQLLQLLLNAVNKVDELEQCDNNNKRWSPIVERTLNKRLFAMEWNIDLNNLHGDGD